MFNTNAPIDIYMCLICAKHYNNAKDLKSHLKKDHILPIGAKLEEYGLFPRLEVE